MSDRRYSTSAWQRTRKAILRRDNYECQIRGPRCLGRASTVHHVIPSSERPDLFFSSGNLQAACTRCNYGGGRGIAVDRSRNTIAQLKELVLAQQEQIAHLTERLAAYERQPPAGTVGSKPPMPAIY
jgi:hypothetical protein